MFYQVLSTKCNLPRSALVWPRLSMFGVIVTVSLRHRFASTCSISKRGDRLTLSIPFFLSRFVYSSHVMVVHDC